MMMSVGKFFNITHVHSHHIHMSRISFLTFLNFFGKFFFEEEYNTHRNRCQLTRCRVDQHSSRVLSLIAGGFDGLFDRDNCWKII